MMFFTDEDLYLKGTCNLTLSDVETGDICFQSNRVNTGSISPGVTLEEVRGGLGNAVAAMLSSDANVTVDFEVAEFSLWAKAAQVGAALEFGAPVPKCQIVKAGDYTLAIDTRNGAPVAKDGNKVPICHVQTVGETSFIMDDGTAYQIGEDGTVNGFTAVPGTTYKVWYSVQNVSAQRMVIKSFVKPRIVRMEAQMAVYANRTGQMNRGTRVGWLYVTVPYLQLQGDAALNGDQSTNDTTKISGKALTYNPDSISTLCEECGADELAYYVYAPDDDSVSITGIVVMNGAMYIPEGEEQQIPVMFIMGDGSLVVPPSYSEGFTYTVPAAAQDNIAVSPSGVIYAISGGIEGYDTEVTVTYEDQNGATYTCPIDVHVTEPKAAYSNIVGSGLVGYMII